MTSPVQALTQVILLLCLFVAGSLQAQNIAGSVSPNSGGSDYSVDIQNNSGGNWYFYSNPSPAAARMSKVDSSGISESPWGTAGQFAADPGSQVQSRLYPGQFLRIYPKTVPVNSTITVEFAYGPAGTHYQFQILVTNGVPVTSLNILDPNPTGSSSVRWRATFGSPVSGVTAANFAFNNPANISGLSIASVTADSAQPSSNWTITANTGTGNGILGLKWVGHVSEVPTVPNSFTGQSYDFTFGPVVNTQPVGGGINRNSTKTLTVGASIRGGGTPSYQWYAGATFATATAINGATSASYTPPNFAQLGSFSYFCKVYNSTTFTWSDTATIVVVDPPAITVQPANLFIASNNVASPSVTATGTSLNYQWYRGTAPDTTNPVGIGGASYTSNALTANTAYWVRISNAGPTVVNSNTATVTVVSSLTAGAASYSSTVGTTLGTAFSVTARDSANQVVPNISIVFTAPASGAKGSFPSNAATATVTTNASGVATAPTFTVGTVAGNYNVVASFGTLTKNLPMTNVPGAPTSLAMALQPPASVPAGQAFSPAPALSVKDTYGNICTNNSSLQVTASRSGGAGTLKGTLTATASAGAVVFSDLKHETAGTMTVGFVAGGMNMTSSNVAITPGAASTVTASAGSSQTVAPGASFPVTLEATVRDVFDNLVPSTNVTFTPPASGASAKLGGSVVATDSSGKATVTAQANGIPGAYSVTASVAGTPGTSYALKNEGAWDAWRLAGLGSYANSGNSGDFASPQGDGVSNFQKYAFNLNTGAADGGLISFGGTKGLPAIIRNGSGQLFYQFVRRKASTNPGFAYWVESSSELPVFSSQDLATATLESIDATWERVSLPLNPSVTDKNRYLRTDLAYSADFNNGQGASTLLGNAVAIGQAIRLTDSVNSQSGAVILENVTNPATPKGFTARFKVKMGPTTNNAADGMSFAVGDLGTTSWGEAGPQTAQNLAVGFDTYENNAGQTSATGIHLFVNGTHLQFNATNPYTNGNFVDAEVSYDLASGVTVKFNGATIFDKVAVPTFTLTQGAKYGFGGRTGGANEVNVVDEVFIAPR
ncbi:hypothetical protein [Haloferula sp. BvORR071]|uniref:lectin-like domain-containing protein n=1 Tax=Haloferula sp. BvORR071 TaxID=1396141 RepID=UPI002240F6ED|nr:hypothetical protein [Haloferula sp. BvORR071]